MFEGGGFFFGSADGEEFPRLTDEELAAFADEPLPAEFAHLKPFGADPDVLVVSAAEAGPGVQTLGLLTAVPYRVLSESARSLALQQLEKLSATVEAEKAALTAVIAGPAPATAAQRWDDFAPMEVAVATGCSVYGADRTIGLARDLDSRLAATRAAMRAGSISAAQARELSEATRHITDRDLLAEIEGGLLRFSHRQDLTKFRRSLTRWLVKKDPDWQVRAERARRDVSVIHHANGDGTGELAVRGPLETTALIDLALAAIAQQTKPELGGTVAERKFVALRDWADAVLTAPDAPTRHGMAIRVQIVTHADTVLGRDDTPAEIPGVGFIPASAARWALADGAEIQALLVEKRTGYLTAVDPTVYQVPPSLADLLISRYVTSAAPHSTVTAGGADMEHNIPHPTGPTDQGNVTPVCRRWHRAKTHGGWTYTKDPTSGIVTWRSPTGLTADIDPYNYRADP